MRHLFPLPVRLFAQALVLHRLAARLLVARLFVAFVLLAALGGATRPAQAAGGVGAFGSNESGQLGNGSTNNSSTFVRSGTLTSITKISAGGSHSLALRSNGSVVAWGDNGFGQLGNGTTTSSRTPVAVTGLSSGVIAVSAGAFHSLALKSNGSVVAWGYNNYGQLGDTTTTNRSIPVLVNGLATGVSAISAGGYHSMSLSGSGVEAWGNNTYGQLGNGTTTNRTTPQVVSGLGSQSGGYAISAGFYHSLAIRVTASAVGTVLAWGNNQYGQLGDNSVTNRLKPVTVSGLSSGATDISAGTFHSMALRTNDSVVAWGRNDTGQLGDGSTTTRIAPVAVSGLSSGVSAISGGGYHSLALKSNGGVVAWGRNDSGQLGNGTTTDRRTPVAVTGLSSNVAAISAGAYHSLFVTGSANSAPVARADSLSVSAGRATSIGVLANDFDLDGNTLSISSVTQGSNGSVSFTATSLSYTGNSSYSGTDSFTYTISDGSGGTATATVSLYVVEQGALYSWGDNQYGQLGDGSTTSHSSPQPGGARAAKISAGGGHSLALRNDGSVVAWGNNDDGELGNGSTTRSSAPVMVSGLSSGVIAVSAGSFHSLALKSDGSVVAWGDNTFGQLGNGGTTARSTTPVAVTGLSSGVVAISAGQYHSLALRSDGSVVAWGYNNSGQLGDGTTTTRRTPVALENVSINVVAISAGGDTSLALRGGGRVNAWGDNTFGQLGNNTTTSSSTPVVVSGLDFGSGVTAISTGYAHAMALKNDGSVVAWGYNLYGQLGNGTQTNSSTPVTVIGLSSGVAAISAGGYHSMALRSDSSVAAWGRNDSGQLGDGTTTQRTTPVAIANFKASAIDGGGSHSLALPVPIVTINSVKLAEGNSGTTSFTFTVTRGGDTGGASSVNYSVGGGNATAGTDYGTASDSDGDTPGVLTIAAGQTSGTISVPVVGDSTFEGDETFNVTLSAPTGAALGSPSVGVGTITDDDLSSLMDVTRPGDPITASSTNFPVGQEADKAIDNILSTKYLNFDKLNSGFTVMPSLGATIVTGLRLSTGGDAPERDPLSFTLSGSNDGINFTAIVSNAQTGLQSDPGRNAPGAAVAFSNTTAYTQYRLMFPTVRNATSANSMQVAEVELLGRLAPPPAPSDLVATTASASQINLDWTDNSFNESSFKIERSDNGSSGWTEIATVDANIVTYSDTGLSAGTTYFYRVRSSLSDVGDSTYSNTANATTSSAPSA